MAVFMKNSLIKGSYIESDKYSYVDYTEKKYVGVLDLPEVNSTEYIEYYQLADNEKIEYISFKLYSNENYWDLLLYINGMSPLFDSPYDFNVLSDNSNSLVDDYISRTGVRINETNKQNLIDSLINKNSSKNELHRTIKVIKPSKLQDFLKIIRTKGLV